MVSRVAGGKALPDEVTDRIVAKTDGVPLFVEELTKMVVESGLLHEYEDGYELRGPLPPLAIPSTLQDSLMARLDRLATVKEVAQFGATIGRAFPYDLLRAVSSIDDQTLQRELRRLVEAELVYERGSPPQATYTFKRRRSSRAIKLRWANMGLNPGWPSPSSSADVLPRKDSVGPADASIMDSSVLGVEWLPATSVAQAASRLLDQLPRASTQGARELNRLICEKGALTVNVQSLVAHHDPWVALNKRLAAMGALRPIHERRHGPPTGGARRGTLKARVIADERRGDLVDLGQGCLAYERETGVTERIAGLQ